MQDDSHAEIGEKTGSRNLMTKHFHLAARSDNERPRIATLEAWNKSTVRDLNLCQVLSNQSNNQLGYCI